MTDQAAPVVSAHEQLQADYARLWRQHSTLIARLQQDLDRTRGTAPSCDLPAWAKRALTEDIPLEVLADCLPYSGAGPDEATALIDHLTDHGWWIVPAPQPER